MTRRRSHAVALLAAALLAAEEAPPAELLESLDFFLEYEVSQQAEPILADGGWMAEEPAEGPSPAVPETPEGREAKP